MPSHVGISAPSPICVRGGSCFTIQTAQALERGIESLIQPCSLMLLPD